MEEMKYGSAVPCMVCWLQTTFVLAWLWLKSAKANLSARDSATGTCSVQNQWHRAFPTWFHRSLDQYGGNEIWFSSALLGVLAANNLGFGLNLAEIYQSQPFGQQQCHRDMVCPKSVAQSLPNMVPSLIGPIWRK
jgi:hypothetical protein